MSITVKNVDWSQTESELYINVQIKAKNHSDDVVIAEKFLKINARPYFYELFFERPICVEESSCKILESNVKLYLKKASNEWWISLKDDTITPERKMQILSEHENKMKNDLVNCKKERSAIKRNEIDKEIERESLIRKRIDETEANLKISQDKHTPKECIAFKEIEKSTQNKSLDLERAEKLDMPPIRSCGKICISLSEREFVTPKRESLESAERDWCTKQHGIMANRIGLSDEDFNSNERDVFWIINKGISFLEVKNFQAAASAFSFGLKMSSDLPELFLGRARAQYGLRNYKYCAEDSSDALERYKPVVQLNLLSRIHCFWLRGKSLISLGFVDHGKMEIEMAQQLDPVNFKKNINYFLRDESLS